MNDPIQKSKKEFEEIISKISLPDSPVGIDAQYTHAIIITYLQQIFQRLDHIETRIKSQEEGFKKRSE